MESQNKKHDLQFIRYEIFKSQNPENGRFDVVFDIDGKKLYAHKTMLILVSSTFDTMLSDRWTSNKDELVKIETCSYDNFYQFTSFLYSNKCQLTDGNIFVMVDIAEFYGVNLFKTYCDQYLAAMETTAKNIFQLLELVEKYSMAQLKSSAHTYIYKNFNSFVECDGFLKADKQIIENIVVGVKDEVKPEALFLAVFKWCEKQAMDKKTDEPNLNLNETIKNEFSDFLPHIPFDKMEMYFLLDSVASHGYIFNSYKELSKILCDGYPKAKVKITNVIGQTLLGNLINDENVVENIKLIMNSLATLNADRKGCYWNKIFKRPKTPSPLTKEVSVEWYLVYFRTGHFGLRHCSGVDESHYLLAEMTSVNLGFEITQNCKIEIK